MIDTIAIPATEETEARDLDLEKETDQPSKKTLETIAITATAEAEAREVALAIETERQSSTMIETTAITATEETEAGDIAQTDQQSKSTVEPLAITATEVALGKETNQHPKPTTAPLTLKPRTIALDPEIIKALHPKSRIIRAHDLPTHPLSRHILIATRSPMPSPLRSYPEHWLGIHASYHLKLHPSPLILRAEFHSARAIHHTIPHAAFVAKPLACGTLSQDPSTCFLLSYHHDLDFDLQKLNLPRFMATLASLHLGSGSQSGIFGFSIPTYAGSLALLTKTWEGYFTASLSHLLALEKEIQGPYSAEMQGMVMTLFRDVIPRLLRPLETFPNKLTPTLLHGNITPATVATSRRTGAPMVCEPCAFYGHNEYDLMAFVEGGFGAEALRLYRRFVPISEPREDFGDRMRLYSLVGLVRGSCRGGDKGREQLVEGMRGVVGRFWGDGVGVGMGMGFGGVGMGAGGSERGC